ncbi:metallophosphoesterase family protein [Sabulicella glaciei]|uniref:Metallophosphatase family protein n=1 Tax=Sabulicella glaciei TaxID=2984948 RepID=A0ABT3NUX9_9PROT|nr:metallophosphoesterase family protein [Roseococcus sp. MDT2-1-1]MCW8085951.1 metallophosphatase family protein [Roseococcus sp. MDT2-1-1]
MKLALFADVHSNLQALEACLEHAATQGAQRLLFLGDLVGYGADPSAVVARVRGLGAPCLQGNHDQAATHGPRGFSPLAAAAMRWTQGALSAEDRAWLDALPLLLEEEDRLFVHADASAPAEWRYVEGPAEAQRSLAATEARLTFCGHTHVPLLCGLLPSGQVAALRPPMSAPVRLEAPGRWLCVMGAVGQPRDGRPAACYGLFDTGTNECTWMRVPYDVAEAASRIRAAGLPEELAARLAVGR